MCNLVLAFVLVVLPTSAIAQGGALEQVKEAQKLIQSGNVDEAVMLLKTAVASAPDSYEARLELGRALNLAGEYRAARVHLERAITLATDEQRNAALVAMAISYAFESKANEAARYYERVIDRQMQANDRAAAAAAANALARIYLESGDHAKAEQWYRTGYETSKKIPQQSPAQLALWEMRWHHALARIAARRGKRADALKHGAEVKRLLDEPGHDNQRPQYPYLMGYVSLYTKQYKDAVAELQQADLKDPFVLALLAQAHDRLGEKDKARDYYQQVMAIPAHNINAAFARPLARRYLARQRR